MSDEEQSVHTPIEALVRDGEARLAQLLDRVDSAELPSHRVDAGFAELSLEAPASLLAGLARTLAPYVAVTPGSASTSVWSIHGHVDASLFAEADSLWKRFRWQWWNRITGHPTPLANGYGYDFFTVPGAGTIGRFCIDANRQGIQAFYLFREDLRQLRVLLRSGSPASCDTLARAVRSVAGAAARASGHRALHAACVATEEGAWVLVGDRHAGKTTAMLGALAHGRGTRLVGNDRIILTGPANAKVAHGYPQKVGVRRGTLTLLSALSSHLTDAGSLSRLALDQSGTSHRPLLDAARLPRVESNVHFGPVQLAAVFGTEVRARDRLAGVIVLEPNAPRVWRRMPQEQLGAVLDRYSHARLANNEQFWDELYPPTHRPLTDPDVPLYSLDSRAPLDRVWGDFPHSIDPSWRAPTSGRLS